MMTVSLCTGIFEMSSVKVRLPPSANADFITKREERIWTINVANATKLITFCDGKDPRIFIARKE
jgi:hypothetical protein